MANIRKSRDCSFFRIVHLICKSVLGESVYAIEGPSGRLVNLHRIGESVCSRGYGEDVLYQCILCIMI
jgi:hypothetical protein